MKQRLLAIGLIIVLQISSFQSVLASGPDELGCETYSESSDLKQCCVSWQDKNKEIDQEWEQWWEEMQDKKRDTSFLVPHATSALRTYYCKLREVCRNVEWSRKNVDQEEEELFILGCFQEEEKKNYEYIPECGFQNSNAAFEELEALVSACFYKAKLKVEEEKLFLKNELRRDAAHKKTGILLARIRTIMNKVRGQLLDHAQQVMANFDKLAHKIGCTIQQCD